MGILTSKFYLHLAQKDLFSFQKLILYSFLLVASLSLLKAACHFVGGSFTILCRNSITTLLQSLYVQKNVLYSIQAKLDNPDQRITQDIDLFVTDGESNYLENTKHPLARVLIESLVLDPFLIAYYTYETVRVGKSWLSPILVYIYFIISVFICKPLMKYLISLNIQKEKLEGDFRYKHVSVRDHAEEISFWKGHAYEYRSLTALLTDLLSLHTRVLNYEAPLKFLTEFINYSGAILSYIIVGFAIFNSTENLSSSELSERISQHAFMCMYLIFRFTLITDHFEKLARFIAVYKRLEQFYTLMTTSSPEILESMVQMYPNDQDDNNESTTLLTTAHTPSMNPSNPLHISLQTPHFAFMTTLYQGKAQFIKGPTGCGKTTLLRHIAHLTHTIPPYILPDYDTNDILISPQRAYILPGEPLLNQLSYPALDQINPKLYEKMKQVLRIRETGWSEGEKRRIMYGRCMLTKAKFVVLDEPDAGLSKEEGEWMRGMLINGTWDNSNESMKQGGKGVLCITHGDVTGDVVYVGKDKSGCDKGQKESDVADESMINGE